MKTWRTIQKIAVAMGMTYGYGWEPMLTQRMRTAAMRL